MGGLRGDDDGAGRPTVAVLTTWARGSARKEVAAGVSVGTRADVEAGGGADAAMGEACARRDAPVDPHPAADTTTASAASARAPHADRELSFSVTGLSGLSAIG
jgi:hypothetical protein